MFFHFRSHELRYKYGGFFAPAISGWKRTNFLRLNLFLFCYLDWHVKIQKMRPEIKILTCNN